MKRIICFLALTTLTAVASSYGQETASSVQIGTIRRPTPAPSANGTTAAKATGPADAGLFKDAKGESASTTFGPNDTIYVVGKNIDAKKGDKVGVNWYGKADKKLTANDATMPNDGVYNPSFHLSPPAKGTPAGSYRADFVHNGKVVKKLSFNVK